MTSDTYKSKRTQPLDPLGLWLYFSFSFLEINKQAEAGNCAALSLVTSVSAAFKADLSLSYNFRRLSFFLIFLNVDCHFILDGVLHQTFRIGGQLCLDTGVLQKIVILQS